MHAPRLANRVPRPPLRLGRSPAPWRSGYAAACKAVDTGSIPVGASSRRAKSLDAARWAAGRRRCARRQRLPDRALDGGPGESGQRCRCPGQVPTGKRALGGGLASGQPVAVTDSRPSADGTAWGVGGKNMGVAASPERARRSSRQLPHRVRFRSAPLRLPRRVHDHRHPDQADPGAGQVVAVGAEAVEGDAPDK